MKPYQRAELHITDEYARRMMKPSPWLVATR